MASLVYRNPDTIKKLFNRKDDSADWEISLYCPPKAPDYKFEQKPYIVSYSELQGDDFKLNNVQGKDVKAIPWCVYASPADCTLIVRFWHRPIMTACCGPLTSGGPELLRRPS
jgi:hypothetical protein